MQGGVGMQVAGVTAGVEIQVACVLQGGVGMLVAVLLELDLLVITVVAVYG